MKFVRTTGRFYSILSNLFDTDEKQDNGSIIMTKKGFSSRKKKRTSIEFTI